MKKKTRYREAPRSVAEALAASKPIDDFLPPPEKLIFKRPSIKVTQLAKRFASSVWIGVSEDGPWTDAKSIARVMAMKAPVMTTLHFAAEGSDAEEAVNTLVRLVENDFKDVGPA